MRKTLVAITVVLCGTSNSTNAQVHVDINLGRPVIPVIAERVPVREASYYYLPEAEAYYYIPTKRYYYYDNSEWVSKAYLPGKYRKCNAYSMRRVAVREPRPYLRHSYYRNRYAGSQAFYHEDSKQYKDKKYKKHKGKGHGRNK